MWEFFTEPEFQEKLDWMTAFVRDECEPLDLLFPRPGDPYDVHEQGVAGDPGAAAGEGEGAGPVGLSPRPRARRPGLRPAQAGADERDPRPLGLGADGVRHRRPRHRQRRDPRPVRHAGAEGALPPAAARGRHRVHLLDDRAAGGRRPQGVRLQGHAGRRRVGDRGREVVLVQRPLRLVPHRHGGDRSRRQAARADVDVHRAGRDARHRDHPQRRDDERARRPGRGHPGLHPLQPGPGAARRDARRRRARASRSPSPGSAAAACTTPCGWWASASAPST